MELEDEEDMAAYSALSLLWRNCEKIPLKMSVFVYFFNENIFFEPRAYLFCLFGSRSLILSRTWASTTSCSQ